MKRGEDALDKENKLSPGRGAKELVGRVTSRPFGRGMSLSEIWVNSGPQ